MCTGVSLPRPVPNDTQLSREQVFRKIKTLTHSRVEPWFPSISACPVNHHSERPSLGICPCLSAPFSLRPIPAAVLDLSWRHASSWKRHTTSSGSLRHSDIDTTKLCVPGQQFWLGKSSPHSSGLASCEFHPHQHWRVACESPQYQIQAMTLTE